MEKGFHLRGARQGAARKSGSPFVAPSAFYPFESATTFSASKRSRVKTQRNLAVLHEMEKHIDFHDDVHGCEIKQDEQPHGERPEFRIRVHFDTCSLASTPSAAH